MAFSSSRALLHWCDIQDRYSAALLSLVPFVGLLWMTMGASAPYSLSCSSRRCVRSPANRPSRKAPACCFYWPCSISSYKSGKAYRISSNPGR